MTDILCTVLWVPYRVVHTIRRSQLHESFALILAGRIELSTLLKINLKCMSLRVVLDPLNQILTLTPCDRFTAESGTPGMLKSKFSSLIARLNSLSALNDAMSRFSAGTNSFTVCVKTVLELYDLEIHHQKLGPDYHRLKTMVKKSIEQEIRNKNFGISNGNYEKSAVVKNQGAKQRVQRILGDCLQWEVNGQCVKGDNCSFRHDMNKRGKVTPSNPSPNSFMQQNERKSSRTRSPRGRSPSGRMSRWLCKDYFQGTCNNSFCEKWHPPECLFYKTESGCRFGEKCSFAHRQVDEQPTKRSQTNSDKSAVAMLKKGNWQEREFVSDAGPDRTGQPMKRSD